MKKVLQNALITKLLYGKDAEFILKYVQNFSFRKLCLVAKNTPRNCILQMDLYLISYVLELRLGLFVSPHFSLLTDWYFRA